MTETAGKKKKQASVKYELMHEMYVFSLMCHFYVIKAEF
jgi:hypothetical protein